MSTIVSGITQAFNGKCLGYDCPTVVALLVGTGGALVLFYKLFRNRGGKPSSRVPVLKDANIAVKQPELAVSEAATHIVKGEINTLGELVFFFRGRNERTIRINRELFEYLRKTYPSNLPSKAPVVDAGAWKNGLCCAMMQQLCHCEEQAGQLEKERATAFDDDNPQHTALLKRLWLAAGWPQETFARRGNEWADFGFQGLDPATDLRGGGVLALRQFVHFAEVHGEDLKEMMAFNKKSLAEGKHHWYLLAVVSIQLTAQLLLQRDHKIFVPQLEVLYDTVPHGGSAGQLIGVPRSAARLSRQNAASVAADCHGEPDRWINDVSDFEIGFFTLHHQLLLHFRNNWHRDLPHVMEYNNYMPKVFGSFFRRE
uniref:WGS project CAEQ00000000 data, annotated contig 1909 n=1 Tax=Trypanosoma congolense (strain IL3000) TaxID=1068625 RepID=F9W9X6_TRYCI|nr:unnamed protein product [Trypanosoma congolense IL3000]